MFDVVWQPAQRDAEGLDRAMACPACGDLAEKPPALVVRGAGPGGTDWWLLRCGTCGGLVSPDRSGHDYGGGDPFGVALDLYLEQGAGIDCMMEPLAWIEPARVRRLLEIGGGFGFVSDIGRQVYGWDCVGYDPSPLAVAGRELLHLDNRAAYFDTDTPLPEPFDIAFASEVIEHIADPAPFLSVMVRAVGGRGMVLLTTPDAAAVRPETPSSLLNAILSPGLHLTLFTVAGLEALLRSAGFPVVKVVSQGSSLRAVAGFDPSALRADPRPLGEDYLAYLSRRLEGPLHPALESGLRYRLFRTLVGRADLGRGLEQFQRISDMAARRHGLDLDRPETLADGLSAPMDLAERAKRQPLNLCGTLYHRAVIANNLERDPGRTVDFALAAAAAGGALRRSLHVAGMDDGETGDLTEQSLILALHILPATDPARATVLFLELADDPAGAGLDPTALSRLAVQLAEGLKRHHHPEASAALLLDLAARSRWDLLEPFRPYAQPWGLRHGDWPLCFALGLAASLHPEEAAGAAHAFQRAADILLAGPAGEGDPVGWRYWWESGLHRARALHRADDRAGLADQLTLLRHRHEQGPSCPAELAAEFEAVQAFA